MNQRQHHGKHWYFQGGGDPTFHRTYEQEMGSKVVRNGGLETQAAYSIERQLTPSEGHGSYEHSKQPTIATHGRSSAPLSASAPFSLQARTSIVEMAHQGGFLHQMLSDGRVVPVGADGRVHPCQAGGACACGGSCGGPRTAQFEPSRTVRGVWSGRGGFGGWGPVAQSVTGQSSASPQGSASRNAGSTQTASRGGPGAAPQPWRQGPTKVDLWIQKYLQGQTVMGVFKAAPNGDLIFESCDDAIAFVHKLAQMAKTNKQIKPCALVSCWQGGAVVTCKACPDGLAWQWIEVKPGTKVWVAPCVSKKVYKAPSGWPPGKAWVVDINGKAVPSNQMCPGGRAPQFIALDNGGYLMVCGDEAPGCMTPDGQVGCGDGQACIKCSDSSEYSCIDIADGCDGYSLEDVPECLSAAQCPCAEGAAPTCSDGKCGCADNDTVTADGSPCEAQGLTKPSCTAPASPSCGCQPNGPNKWKNCKYTCK